MTARGDKVRQRLRLGIALSSILHLLLLVVGVLLFRGPLSTQIVVAGEGQGTGQGGAIEVGVVEASQLGFAKPRAVSHLGEEMGEANNTIVETRRPASEPDAEVLPSAATKPPKATEKTTATERPTANQTEQIFSQKPLRGRSAGTNVEVGRTYGSPVPAMAGGVGIAGGGGAGHGTGGVPGGSEYGRRIQMILSRNYNPPAVEAGSTHYVIIRLRIARDGRVLSLAGNRLASDYVKQRSSNELVNYAAERAVIASNPLPPFPAGFLMGAQEAVAEVWFRYPK
jgi:hypothetical protein